eukprot:1593596-Alexandrium_andersonii.AAC.1
MVRLLSEDGWGVAGEQAVDRQVVHEVGLEHHDVHVEGAIEAGQGVHNGALGVHEVVQVVDAREGLVRRRAEGQLAGVDDGGA